MHIYLVGVVLTFYLFLHRDSDLPSRYRTRRSLICWDTSSSNRQPNAGLYHPKSRIYLRSLYATKPIPVRTGSFIIPISKMSSLCRFQLVPIETVKEPSVSTNVFRVFALFLSSSSCCRILSRQYPMIIANRFPTIKRAT